EGNIHGGLNAQVIVGTVSLKDCRTDADNRQPRSSRIVGVVNEIGSEPDAFSNRVLVRKVFRVESRIHDCNLGPRSAVGLSEITTTGDGNVEHPKITRDGNDPVDGGQSIVVVGQFTPLDIQYSRAGASGGRMRRNGRPLNS